MDEQKRRYLTIKLATEKFKLNPEYLSSIQKAGIEEEVIKLYQLQSRILASQEAKQVNVTRKELDEAYQSCIDQYESKDEFYQSLKNQGLTVEGLKYALKDELYCDAVLDYVSQDIPPLDKQQALDYYEKNKLEFSRAKTWNLSQILITINDEFEENTRENALAKIKEVREMTESEPFSDLAVRYSECPSAVENGYLGWCEEGKLYSEITSALYHLPKEQVSEPIETEVGFHLIVWHDEKPPYMAPFEEAWPFLQEKHNTRAKQYLQRQWIAQLISHPVQS
ncbi:peptidylprolyl isomerase [Vibrio albus]|uniref:peptidylprolyl isomerase n=1 Tax=Vibrio albus TaxID=2200953 RepID=A0A2U3BAP9_9VIBR|nr:peptidylprolyl isomerase [Vibrio albus]PWI33872.1 peptidylprolyl isomerase [Vibrio albus]